MRTQALITLGAMLFCFAFSVSAQEITDKGQFLKEHYGEAAPRAAGCAPATAIRDLEWNNVRALLENGGSLWHNRAISNGSYEVPKGTGLSTLYGGALWLGGISPDQQLKIAAVRYRSSGNDFWPGPLTNDGTAEIEENVCNQYDKFYVSIRSDAQQHRRYYDCVNDPTCDLETEFEGVGYSIPSYFFDYPAHGNTALGQDYYLAPFFDYDEDGNYDPSSGDYPWFDFLGQIDCSERRREDAVPLFGDQNYFWVFNDKGNVHSESQGDPIGMEIRGQAFAFSTNDEINNMTFYNYVLINQGTQTLTETYFGQWIDCDLGNFSDDYVGCDVQRGLGYVYNGFAVDPPGALSAGYGENPPAFGVDFFEGPYQDSDEIDNPLTLNFTDAVDSLGIPYRGIGIGYGDGIVDNERFGMRKFLYHNFGSSGVQGLPGVGPDFYNYMRGFWLNNQRMAYGGDGLNPGTGADLSIPADYMFPDDTDPVGWGTGGVAVEPWTEQSSDNAAGDRLFLQSAGPFTLEPGDYNNITVGLVYARANAGDPFESVELLRVADDKAQALFDNCFEIVSGPDAPDVAVQELDNELILYLSNENGLSNNYRENYIAFDPGIPGELEDGTVLDTLTRSFLFQGYQIYQLKNENVGPNDLGDVELARLIATVDVEDSIGVVVNYITDPELDLPVPTLMANGPNEGIQHSFQVLTDAFAQGDNQLVNYKKYHFMVLAYAQNNYREYNPLNGSGQDEQFKASRKAATGSLRVYTGVPHPPVSESGGTISSASYGDGVEITRLEGRGNGGNVIDITTDSENAILENTFSETLTYQGGAGPVEIKIIDPLNVGSSDFELRLAPDDADLSPGDTAHWEIRNLTWLQDNDPSNDLQAVISSNEAIDILNEQLLLDWGISVSWQQFVYTGPNRRYTDPIEATIDFENSSRPWLQGIPDQEGFSELNWIRAGTQDAADEAPEEEVVFDDIKPGSPLDQDELYEGLLGGTWAPYCLVSYTDDVTFEGATEAVSYPLIAPTTRPLYADISATYSGLNGLNNVDVVLTNKKELWTRVGVIEMQPNPQLAQDIDGDDDKDATKMLLRRHPSVDKNGLWNNSQPGYNQSEATLDGAQPIGMGWFPGYAIDVGTGERLNMAFGEDSWLGADNGKDMIWNPSSRLTSDLGGDVYAGGQHWIYVFKNSQREEANEDRMPAYDQGQYIYNGLEANFDNTTQQRRVFRATTWVGSALSNDDFPMLSAQDGLVPNDCRIRLRINKPYDKYSPTQVDYENYDNSENLWNPLYTFSTKGARTITNDTETLKEALDVINIVPNPYYAYSEYEETKLDNRAKLINLPEECTISIYTINGTLIRQFKKADPLTYLDWDLKNQRNVPIAGGVYIIHIEVPGAGEKILKWFGIMRPTDLDNF